MSVLAFCLSEAFWDERITFFKWSEESLRGLAHPEQLITYKGALVNPKKMKWVQSLSLIRVALYRAVQGSHRHSPALRQDEFHPPLLKNALKVIFCPLRQRCLVNLDFFYAINLKA